MDFAYGMAHRAGMYFSRFGLWHHPTLIYDKTVDTAIPQKTTLALAFVMVMNYLAILLSPFITDFFQWIFHTGSQEFPFIFNLCITILIMYWAYAKKEEFLFSDK